MSQPQNPMSESRQNGPKNDSARVNTNTTKNTAHYRPSRLFALIIGINKYQSGEFPQLRGAVPDGKAFQDYLIKRLGVPKDQISTLFEKQATRSAIIEAFQNLSKDDRIHEGDPIFIFYAGHGSQEFPHPEWKLEKPNEKIEVIIPYDCTSNQNPSPGRVQPIPDLTTGALIDEIARTKGDNITVVFDCCHSASGTRGGGVRSVCLGDAEFDRNTDCSILDCRSRGSRPYDAYSRRGLRSHMLIAACSSTQVAVEHENRGRLSVALLKLFETVSPDKLRYCDILANIEPIPNQSPQCEGHAQTRFLFNGEIGLSRKVYRIKFEKRASEYVLEAGAADGIATGAEFMVYRDTDTKLMKPLGTLIIDELMDFFAKMKLPRDSALILSPPIPVLSAIPSPTKAGKLADFLIHIPPNDPFYPVYHAKCHSDAKNHNIHLVAKPTDAHLKIRTSLPKNLLIFEHSDERVNQYGVNLIKDDVEPDPNNVSWILQRAAHYHRELNRTRVEHVITAGNLIEVEFFGLDPGHLVHHINWTAEHMTITGPNLCRNNVIDFVVEDENKPYGVNIKNNTELDLHLNVFFFDHMNFEITSFYLTHCPNGPYLLEPPLKRGSSLSLGYGRAGEQPFMYHISGQDLDVGFLKIYLSTKALDLSGIEQSSPFTQPPFTETRSPRRWRRPQMNETWDTILIPVIQRRA